MDNQTVYTKIDDKTVKEEKKLPELWPGWKTIREIGTGGFGAVYEIQQNTLGVKSQQP